MNVSLSDDWSQITREGSISNNMTYNYTGVTDLVEATRIGHLSILTFLTRTEGFNTNIIHIMSKLFKT